jgi:dienelactone hydrolase
VAEILLFHHALGLTRGVLAFADELRTAGHVVHTPDLYEGKTFATVDEGVAHAREVGFGPIFERGVRAADGLPNELVYAGFSLGVPPAQQLVQTRPGAKGGLFFHAAIPLEEFGGSWPAGVPAQIHVMENDELGDVDEARGLADAVDDVELFLYPGDKHLFAEPGFADYDEAAAALMKQRVLEFLG